jgi:DNA-binding winged helix-turn-helix (wHTH) protein
MGVLPLTTTQGKILLQEQPFQVLRMLVEREGEVISREEIQQKLWPKDTGVERHGSEMIQ